MKSEITQVCPACDGIGKMKILWITFHCSTCHGTGTVSRPTKRAADFAPHGGIYLEPKGSHDTNPFDAQDKTQNR